MNSVYTGIIQAGPAPELGKSIDHKKRYVHRNTPTPMGNFSFEVMLFACMLVILLFILYVLFKYLVSLINLKSILYFNF